MPIEENPMAKVSPGGSEQTVIELRQVSRRFGSVLAVDSASFSVERGEFVTVLGPSGSGKSTLLMMIAGFLAPSAGEIFVDGEPVSDKAPHERNIGMVFQTLALFPHMNVFNNIAFPLKMRRMDLRQIGRKVEQALDIVQLQGMAKRRLNELSGGQRQRVALARALVFEPSLLLLDEPLGALDKKLREDMQLELRRIQRRLGITTINVTHDQKEALIMSDRIIVMNQGRIEQWGTAAEIYFQPATRFIADFIGNTNIFEGRVTALSDGAPGRCRVQVGDIAIEALSRRPVAVGDEVALALRAERIRLLTPADQVPAQANAFPCRVDEIIFEGDRTVYVVTPRASGLAVLRVYHHNDLGIIGYRPGDNLLATWEPEDVIVLTQ